MEQDLAALEGWPEPTPPADDLPEGEDADAECGQVPGELLDLYVELEEAGVIHPGDDVPVEEQTRGVF